MPVGSTRWGWKYVFRNESPPLEKGVRGDLNFLLFRYCEEFNRSLVERRGHLIHPLRHSEEHIMRRENLIHPLRHSEEHIMRRENLIL